MKKYFSFILPLIGGVFYATGFPTPLFHTAMFGPIIGLILLFSSLDAIRGENKIGRDVIKLLLFFTGVNFAGYYWIPFTMKEFGGIYPPFNYLMGALFALILMPQYWVYYAVVAFCNRKKFDITPLHLKVFCVAILLTFIDVIVPQQFPAHPGHSWLILGKYLGLASIFGSQLFSFLSYWLVTSVVVYIIDRRFDFFPLIGTAVVIVISLLFPIEFNSTSSLKVRLVQANISNNLKISAEKHFKQSGMTVQGTYRKLSLSEGIDNIDLVIWPETAYPHLVSTKGMREYRDSIPAVVKRTVEYGKADLFFGGYDLKIGNDSDFYFEDQYNTAFLVGNDHEGHARLKEFYHKSRLIPFGETLPFGPLNKHIGRYIQNISYFATGERFPLFKVKDVGFIAAICYEVLSYSFFRDYLNLQKDFPHFAINISNDSWYGDTIEPYQHLFLTKWRAIEFGLPIVRMTNTGISSIIYPDGRESKRSKIFKEQVMDLKLKLRDGNPTLFQRFGLLNLFGLWLILGMILLIISRKQIPLLRGRVNE